MKTKRLVISTVLGLICGLICYGFAMSGQKEVSTALALNVILSRALIGVAIGISRFTLIHWALHGIVMGFVFSLPAGFGAMLGSENPDFSHTMLMILVIMMGMFYGFLIELLTSVVFKEKQ